VTAAALSMDKRLMKAAFRAAGVTVLDDVLVERERWEADTDSVLADTERRFALPVYVKPVSTGSSIGVSRVEAIAQLHDAVELALTYDTRCLIEEAQDDAVEINCAVLGVRDEVRASACEQPKAGGLLTYEDKYLRKSGKAGPAELRAGKAVPQRVVPAPLSDGMTRRVQETAMAAFRAIDAAGVARVDCFVRTADESVVVNEINTVPGSLAFHLWEPAGISMTQVITQLVDIALARHAAKARTAYSIDTWLLTGPPRG
jgi:D-alanine-D-alanine ligase